MKKVQVSFKQREFDAEVESYSILLPLFNQVLNDYKEMGLPQLTLSDFRALLNNPDSLIFEKMTQGQPMEVNGFKIAPEKAFNMLEKPNGYEQLVSAISAVNKEINSNWHLQNVVIENGEIVLNPAFLEKIKGRHTVYVTSEQQLKAYQFTESVKEAAKECFGDIGPMLDINLNGKQIIQTINDANGRRYVTDFGVVTNFGEPGF